MNNSINTKEYPGQILAEKILERMPDTTFSETSRYGQEGIIAALLYIGELLKENHAI